MFDKTATIGSAGWIATLSFSDMVSVVVGIITAGYVLTKWIYLLKSKGKYDE